MRLLRVRDLELQEFFDQDIPPYAIISHRWSKEEVSYQDFLCDRAKLPTGQCKGYGWMKIAKACEIAFQRDIDWVWLDTCCIDKKSSAELSEAINSMFMWYARSRQCWVFLPDVHESVDFDIDDTSYNSSVQNFLGSEWFTRAWTLQELLAPQDLYFFNSEFICVGTRDSLVNLISQATNIPRPFLVSGTSRVFRASVAERMKWASKRKATREEDTAYSLLGIFDVNMPLLYGEGKKAFLRLQTEIIRNSSDESIFAWTSDTSDDRQGVLAPDVSAFTKNIYVRAFFARQHYEVTNKGIRLTIALERERLVERLSQYYSATVLVPLNCGVQDAHNISIRSVLCIRILVNDDPAWANSSKSVSKHLRYLLGSRISLETIQIPPAPHRSDIPNSINNLVRSKDYPTERSSDLVAGLGTKDEIDIPVYFWSGATHPIFRFHDEIKHRR